jgi:hypothetical protein
MKMETAKTEIESKNKTNCDNRLLGCETQMRANNPVKVKIKNPKWLW